MKAEIVPIERPGILLFRSPTKASVKLNHDLLIVFTAPFTRACGIALLEVDTQSREVTSTLDVLLQKMVTDLNVRPEEIRAKIFGLSQFRKNLVTTFEHWADRNQIIIACRDLGRSTTRAVTVLCDNGLVGVRYAEPVAATDLPEFLAPGSARQRLSPVETEKRVLILSTNKVRRLLAKQAVEEHPGYEATAPNDAHQVLAKKHGKNFSFAHVVLFDDLENSPLLKTFIQKVMGVSTPPSFCWVGTTVPKYGSLFRVLPPLEPETITQFKKNLNHALANPTATIETTNTILTFERKKKTG